LEHLVRAQVRRVETSRHGRERAVVATVPAQPGERDEDIAAIGDDARPAHGLQAGVAYARRMAAQGVEVGVARVQQHGDLVDVEGLAVTRACERAAHGRCGRPVVGSTHVSTLGRPDTRRPGSCPSLTRKVASPGLELYY